MSQIQTGGASMSCAAENSSVFQTCFESGDGSGTGDREFQTAGAVILHALDWKLILVTGL